MRPTQDLVDGIYRDRIQRARQVPPGQKILDGLDLFDRSCEYMRVGIRNQHADADEQQVEEILARRINRLRQVEEHGLYQTLESPS